MQVSLIRDVKIPNRGSSKSAGIDFYIPNDCTMDLRVNPGSSILIPSGVKANIPEGYMLTAFNKSGISTKKNMIVGACVCDEDYQGEIHIHLFNNGPVVQEFNPGDKVVQFVLVPVSYDSIEVVPESELFNETSERGEGGFGSTGTR